MRPAQLAQLYKITTNRKSYEISDVLEFCFTFKSENIMGRNWLMKQPDLEEIIELSGCLLESSNIWVSSNAALVIAR